MDRREFLNVLACASASGLVLNGNEVFAADPAAGLYDFKAFGNVHVMHFTDCHAQLLPVYFREPNVNLGVAEAVGRPPHLVGTALLNYFKMNPMAAPAGYARDLRATPRMLLPTLTSPAPPGSTARPAASRIWQRWSKKSAPRARARCCSTAAIPGRARPRHCGPSDRTWSMPANCSASM